MTEPTHRQHLILEGLNNGEISSRKNNDDTDMELIWELVRGGYLNNFALLGGNADWRFSLTDKADSYLQSFSVANRNRE
jgi:hypothetical protein